MKKMMITGAIAAALIATGGTGAYLGYAKADTQNSSAFTQQQGVNAEQMMNTTNTVNNEDMQKFMQDKNVNFGQMKDHMKQMHPDLSSQQLEEHYKSMHGTGGSSNSKDFQGMMGNESL